MVLPAALDDPGIGTEWVILDFEEPVAVTVISRPRLIGKSITEVGSLVLVDFPDVLTSNFPNSPLVSKGESSPLNFITSKGELTLPLINLLLLRDEETFCEEEVLGFPPYSEILLLLSVTFASLDNFEEL